jgi:phosphodiesterase/alkaline phosphatase D-like protein
MKTLRRSFLPAVFAAAALALPASGQIAINQAGTPYTQNFNALPASGTGSPEQASWGNNSTLAGWYLHAGPNLVADVSAIRVTPGSTSSRSQTSYGTDAERALGTQGGSRHDLSPTYQTDGTISENAIFGTLSAAFSNGTGAPLTGFTFSYTGEQWVRSSSSTPSTRDTLTAQWALASSASVAPSSLTWTDFTVAQQNTAGVNFQAPQRGGTSAAIDGNAAANRITDLGATVTGINWPAGQVLFIRWVDINDSGTDGGLAVDDFSFTATAGGNLPPSVSLTSPANAAVFTAPATVSLQATTSDSDGTITKVEFFNGSTKLGEALTAPYSFSWTNVTAGGYTLTAVATDNNGSSTTSAPVSITVNAPAAAFTYTQNFDGLGTGTTLGGAATGTTGWTVIGAMGGSNSSWTNSTGIPASGSPSAATAGTANTTLTVNSNAASATATSNTAGYNFALSGSTTNRALGTSPTTGAGTTLQLTLSNTSGSAIHGFRIGYDIRRFTAPSTANELPGYWCFYSLDNGSTWTNISALNPVLSGGTVNVPNTAGVTTVPLTTVLLSTPWAAGASIRFRWVDDNASETSPDQIIGLDNVTITTEGVNLPPTVSLTAPTANATFALPTSIDLAATASDSDGSIARVEFLANGVKIGEDTSAPYEFVWANAISGTYSLTARAVDNADAATVSSAVSITVTNPNNTPPSISLTAPTDGARLPASVVNLAATATDTDGIVAKVEFFTGSTKIGEDTSAPFTLAWNGPPVGNHTLTAVATDNDGGTTTSAPVQIETVPFVNTRVISQGSVWKYLDNGGDQGTAWSQPTFNDSGWASGPGKLGYEDGAVTVLRQGPDGMTSATKFITYYFRQSFTVPDATKVALLTANVLRDDGVVIYLNGVEAGRSNMPDGPVDYLTNASSIVSGADETTYFPVTLDPGLLVNGVNVIAVELHQRDNTSSDLGFDLELISQTVDGNQAPTVTLTSPANGSFHAVGANIALAATAGDSDGSIVKVEFYSGSTKLGEDATAPYAFTWTNVSAGAYALTALALDNEGGFTISAPVNITVSPPPGIVAGPWSGNMTHNSASISVVMDASGVSTRAVLSTSADLSNPFYSTTAVTSSSAGNSVRLEVTGLQPLTTYHYAIEGNGSLLTSGDLKGKFTTLPEPGPASFRFAFGSCGSYSNTSQFVYESIVNDNPLFFMHMGDMNYQDINSTNPANYRTVYNAQITTGQLRRVCRAMGMTYIWDDHDYAGNDSNKNNIGRAASRQVYRERFPHYPLPAGGPDAAIYQTFTVGRVRYILTDLRSERDPVGNTDNASKSHMGTVQKQWFKDQLIAARDAEVPLIVWNSSVPFISTSTSGDDWGRFQTERTELLNFIKNERIQNIIVVSGDMHALALDDGQGTNAYVSGVRIPVFHGAALAQSGSSKGGPYRVGSNTITVSQGLGRYGIIDVTDNGGGSVTVTFRGRIASGSGSTWTSTADWTFATGQSQFVYNGEPVRPRKALNASASAVPGKIQITWTDNSGVESGYRLERKLASSSTWSTLLTTAPNTASHDDTTALPGTSYDYRVIAVNSSIEADPSNTASATALNNNARLASLTISDGTLSPTFDADTLAYEATVEFGTDTLLVTPTPADANATVTVNGAPASTPVSLALGVNTITLLVTAQDTSTQTYTVAVRRRTNDLRAPVLTLSSPVAGGSVVSIGSLEGDLTVKGILDDDVEVDTLTLSINGGSPRALPLTPVSAKRKTFLETLPGVLNLVGNNTLLFAARDTNGNLTTLTRTVNHIVRSGLSVQVQGTSATGLVTGLATGPVFEVGKSYKLTAALYDTRLVTSSSARFASWSGPGISSTSQVLTLTMTPALVASPVLTATYVVNPFTTEIAGRYHGLIRPLSGGPMNSAAHGHLSIELTSSGAFTGSVHLDGFNLPITGSLGGAGTTLVELNRSHQALPPLELDLAVDLTGGTGRITGTATSGSRVCEIQCHRNAYSAANPVPTAMLNGHFDNKPNQRGYYTLILPFLAQPGMTSAEHPMGTGIGTLSFSRLGVVTCLLRLQDQAAGTAAYSSVIDQDGVIPLFTPLYPTRMLDSRGRPTARFDGSISGFVTLDPTLAGSDLSGLDHRWFRPAQPAATNYPVGWPSGITRHVFGARYNAPLAVPIFTTLSPQNPTTGNIGLRLEDGLLSAPYLRNFNLNPLGGLQKAPFRPKDNTYLMGIYKPTGSITGYFGHDLGKTNFFGVIYQKGPATGGHGFFLSPKPPGVGSTSQSGTATVELK